MLGRNVILTLLGLRGRGGYHLAVSSSSVVFTEIKTMPNAMGQQALGRISDDN